MLMLPPSADLPDCPGNSKWDGEVCVGELVCPQGTEQLMGQCVGAVQCPVGSEWRNVACVPVAPSERPDENTLCRLNLNSIPVSYVLVDGRVVGITPQLGAVVAVGVHSVMFVSEDRGKKSVTVRCEAREIKAVAVKFD